MELGKLIRENLKRVLAEVFITPVLRRPDPIRHVRGMFTSNTACYREGIINSSSQSTSVSWGLLLTHIVTAGLTCHSCQSLLAGHSD